MALESVMVDTGGICLKCNTDNSMTMEYRPNRREIVEHRLGPVELFILAGTMGALWLIGYVAVMHL